MRLWLRPWCNTPTVPNHKLDFHLLIKRSGTISCVETGQYFHLCSKIFRIKFPCTHGQFFATNIGFLDNSAGFEPQTTGTLVACTSCDLIPFIEYYHIFNILGTFLFSQLIFQKTSMLSRKFSINFLIFMEIFSLWFYYMTSIVKYPCFS
jgi:hypothetical protein